MTTTTAAEHKQGRAEDRVAAALAAHPGATAAELAALAGLGASTVGKALASMEAAGAGGRLRPGELRRVVAELLAGCTEPVTATRLARAAGGRSAGAVGNCLERLVAAGAAVRVTEHPKVYLPTPAPADGPVR